MRIRIAALIFTLGASHVALALQDQAALTEGAQAAPEEIVITGIRLRNQLIAAERNAYDVFNKFNDEKRFNISCSINAYTGSHFVRQVCQPEFETAATSAHAQDYLDGMPYRTTVPGGSVAPTHAPMEVEIARQQPAYKLKMKQVAEQHPEFVEAIKQYVKVKEQYERTSGETNK